jgi:hypothetical protein
MAQLFEYAIHVDQRTLPATTLVVTLGSFVDAGCTQELLVKHITSNLPNHVIGEFDVDRLYDYTGNRPMIGFDRDHFHSYQSPRMPLSYVKDSSGRGFLLLSGPEPNLRWEGVADEIAHIVEQHNVEKTVLVSAIPAPVPHTRPIVVSRFASEQRLLEGVTPILGSFKMSGTFLGMLSVRLAEKGHPVLGFIAHVPHYLIDNEVPSSALAVAEALTNDTGIALPTVSLSLAAEVNRAALTAMVQSSQELGEHIAQLETQYDQFVEDRQRITAAVEDLPTADEIGKAAEEFLRGLGGQEPEA